MQTLKNNIRETILKAAQCKFARKGFLKTSMRNIADAAGVGVGNVYFCLSIEAVCLMLGGLLSLLTFSDRK